jgi:hypothetical protein
VINPITFGEWTGREVPGRIDHAPTYLGLTTQPIAGGGR